MTVDARRWDRSDRGATGLGLIGLVICVIVVLSVTLTMMRSVAPVVPPVVEDAPGGDTPAGQLDAVASSTAHRSGGFMLQNYEMLVVAGSDPADAARDAAADSSATMVGADRAELSLEGAVVCVSFTDATVADGAC